MRVVGTRRARRDGQRVRGQFRAFPGDHEGQVGVFAGLLGDVAIVFDHEVGVAVGQKLIALVAGEFQQIARLDQFHQHGLDLDQTVVGNVVERIAEILARQTDQVRGIAQNGDALLVHGRLEDIGPRVGDMARLHLRLAIAEAERQPGVGQRIFAARIVNRVHEAGVDVLDVRNLAVVQRHQQPRVAQARHVVVGRHDHVEARIARLQLGEQFVVGGEQRHVDVDAAGLLEVRQRGVADIGVPVVEVQLGLLARSRSALGAGL